MESEEQLYPLLFRPNLHARVWGGTRLRPLKGLEPNEDPIGESWEVSAVKGKASVVHGGPLDGEALDALTERFGASMLGQRVAEMYGTEFPLLVKFIDAASDLSIQVHPNDELARERHNSLGKTEMWYVLDAEEDAKILCGFFQHITPYEYAKRVEDGSIAEVLRHHRAHKGDVFFLPAGRVHAIGGGTLIAEVQQSSDVTYRIFDYGRLGLDGKPRELHTELASDAIDYNTESSYRTLYEPHINKPVYLADSPYFTVKILETNRSFHRKLFKYDSFVIYVCLQGSCNIEMRCKCPVEWVHLQQGNSCLVPAAVADYNVVPCGDSVRLMEVYIDNKNHR